MGEKVRVLIVDDSAFFRKRIRQQLERTGEVVIAGEATNGREAVNMAASLRPDLITMDVAMPLMDGISAVRAIMHAYPTDILMVSALTSEGARATLEALDAGAVDFLAKQAGMNGDAGQAGDLGERVINIARRKHAPRRVLPAAVVKTPRLSSAGHAERRRKTLRLVAIGASTGGPVAVQRVLAALPEDYPYPVLVAVHMPAEFTATFAERLDSVCRIKVRHAVSADELLPGRVLIAPGGMQTTVEMHAGRLRVRVAAGGELLYKPSVDVLYESAARVLGRGVLAVVLTGMGADGTAGARLLKEQGASVWSQDQASSVVFGMPYAVAKAGCSDRVLALDEIGTALSGLV
ncbi:MAG: chemotaxis response regulator protein-glutamate methylesterase [Chromatiaceae bacterium]|nr:chemotaxis response regulator protein-glutamate methylesterase [Chromatiaceae bacterium]